MRPGIIPVFLRNLWMCAVICALFVATSMAAEKPKKQQLADIACPSDQVLKHDGILWVCAPDNDSPTTALDWNAIGNRPAGLDDGDDDTLGGLSCDSGEVAKANGSGGWECETDQTAAPSTDTLAELDCSAGDVARFNGTFWECSDAVSRLELFQFGKRVFLSSMAFDGDFGGLSGADGTCQILAGEAGLPGTYRAWLSDASGSPATRFTQSATPYFLVDGTIIADDWDDLVDGELNQPINVFETGDILLSTTNLESVWSNTNEAGEVVLSSFSCADWGSSAGTETGLIGSPNSAQTPSEDSEVQTGSGPIRLGWTRIEAEVVPGSGNFGEALLPCSFERSLYCFQQ